MSLKNTRCKPLEYDINVIYMGGGNRGMLFNFFYCRREKEKRIRR